MSIDLILLVILLVVPGFVGIGVWIRKKIPRKGVHYR